MAYILNGGEHTVENGCFTLVPPNAPHVVLGHSDGFDGLFMVGLHTMQGTGALLQHSYLKEYEAIYLNGKRVDEIGMEAALAAKSGFVFKLSVDELSALHYVASLSEMQTPYYGTLVKNRLFEIIHGLSCGDFQRKQREPQEKLIDGRDARIFKAKQFIKDNPHVFLGCDDMAAYCDLSVKQLNRLFFLKYEGLSLSEYLRAAKLEQAKELLTRKLKIKYMFYGDLPRETSALYIYEKKGKRLWQ